MSALALYECEDEAPIDQITWYDEELLITPWDEQEQFVPSGSTAAQDDTADVLPIAPALGYQAILRAIEKSRTILELHDNWDDEGSVGYSVTTWGRATSFLLEQARFARSVMITCLEPPLISPAQEGSIDLYWQLAGRTLLVNIPAETTRPASFYGETSEGNTIGGYLNTAFPRPDLIAWTSKLA